MENMLQLIDCNSLSPCSAAVMCPPLDQPENGAVNCGHEDDVERRFSYENSCGFTCNQGYRLVGAQTVTCTSTTEWSENMPHCEGEHNLTVSFCFRRHSSVLNVGRM